MHLQESGQMYLETIYVLEKKLKAVRSLDIAEHMGFSKPSVCRAVGILKTGNYIHMDKDGYITLTEIGRKIASEIYERHTILTTLLMKIGVSEETATQDACKIEHDISDETFQKLKEFINR